MKVKAADRCSIASLQLSQRVSCSLAAATIYTTNW